MPKQISNLRRYSLNNVLYYICMQIANNPAYYYVFDAIKNLWNIYVSDEFESESLYYTR